MSSEFASFQPQQQGRSHRRPLSSSLLQASSSVAPPPAPPSPPQHAMERTASLSSSLGSRKRKLSTRELIQQPQNVGVECYGGGLWNTWFDRDLSIAGRVIVANKEDGTFKSELVSIPRPILRIPNLAIHLNRDIGVSGFNPNKETDTVPVLASMIKDKLDVVVGGEKEAKGDHHTVLVAAIADALGIYEEFVAARALDNLCMSYICTRALIDSSDSLAGEDKVRMVALFDNEEIGSGSCMGAGSDLISRSLLVSADMAHAVHPNYPEKHEKAHRPEMHKGLVIKQNCNQRYATNTVSSFHLVQLSKKLGIPVQKFVVRNDVGCGSTIGPMLAASTSMRTVDVGVPQLAMHSVREMCGTQDLLNSYTLLKGLFTEYSAIDATLLGTD